MIYLILKVVFFIFFLIKTHKTLISKLKVTFLILD